MPVPDFGAYRDLTPSSLPGIDTQFVYGGWDPLSSEFSFDLIDYNTDFGRGYGFTGAADPEFYFKLSVERDFFGPMLEHLVLESAIAILLFFLLVLMAHDTDLQDRIGLTIFDLIVAAGGLLFAVILDHNALHRRPPPRSASSRVGPPRKGRTRSARKLLVLDPVRNG